MAPRPDRHRLWRALVVLAGVASIVSVHAPLLAYKTFANVDEAYAGALAERLLEGFKLYQGAVSQRGPLMYYAFEGIAWLHGWDNIVGLRVWGLLLALAHFGLVIWVGRSLFTRTTATIAGAIVAYGLAFGLPSADAIAINGESLQMPALLVAVVLSARGVSAPHASRARRTARPRYARRGLHPGSSPARASSSGSPSRSSSRRPSTR